MAGIFKAAFSLMEHKGKILVLLRTDGRWGFPGGGVEPGEDELSAAAREIFEETGHRAEKQDIRLLFVHDKPIRSTKSGKDIIFTIFKLELPDMFEVELDPNEHTEYKWMAPNEALHLKNTVPEFADVLKKAYGPA